MVCTRTSMPPRAISQRRKFSNRPVTDMVLNSTMPQSVIQSTFHTPVAAPYRYAWVPSSSGILHTQAASAKVMIEPSSVASQAGTRNTASMTSRETTGISATRQVSVRLSSGSISCVNMIAPSMRGVWVLCVGSPRFDSYTCDCSCRYNSRACCAGRPLQPSTGGGPAQIRPGRARRMVCAGGGRSGFLHPGGDLLALFHEPPVRRTLLQAVRVLLKHRAGLESLHHHPEADLRADVDIGGTEVRAEDVGSGCQGFLQRCHGVLVAAVAQRAGPGGRRARQHAI